MALDRARVSQPIGVTVDLDYIIDIEYFDAAAPGTVLWAEQIVLPLDATTQQLQARVVERGQAIRRAFQRRDGARTAVPQGTTVAIP